MKVNINSLYITLIFIILGMGVGNATFSIVSNTVTPSQLSPGEFGTLDLIIVNSGAYTITGLSVEIRTTSDITIKSSVNIGDLSPGAQIPISIPFKVDDAAKTGIYSVDLDFFGIGTSTSTRNESIIYNRGVIHKKIFSTLKIVSKPVIQLSMDKNEINDVSELSLILENSKGPAKNIYIKILNDNFAFMNKDLIYVNSLEDKVEFPITIDARNAEDGTHKIKFNLIYQDELGNGYADNRDISVTVRKESGDLVFIQDNSIITGQQQNLVLKIRNDGNSIENLKITFDDNEVQMYGISTINVGNIMKDETKVVTIPVLATAKPGSKQIKVNLKWIEQNKEKESSKTVSVKISADSKIGIYLEARPAPLTIGGEHTISITISNMGSYPIEATTVNIDSEALTLLTIEKEQFVGGLNNDDFSSVQYKVKVNNVEEKDYPITILVKYKDLNGEWKSEKITKIIYPTHAVQTGGSVGIYFVILGLAIIGIPLWFFTKNKKNKSKRVN